MRLAGLLVALLQAAATPAVEPKDPITDRQRFEIALAQRDYLAAQVRLDAAKALYVGKLAEAQRACAAIGQGWHAETFNCQPTEAKE